MNPDAHQRFQQLIDETLVARDTAPDAPELREHLQSCAACREHLDTTMRAISALNGFSFSVAEDLPAAITASLRVRSAQLASRRVSWQTAALASAAALVLTLAGALIDVRLSGLLAMVLEVRIADVQQSLLTFWIGPSLGLLLVFPLLPLLGRRTRGAL